MAVRPNRFGDNGFKGRFFLDDAEYGGTNIYTSNLLYHHRGKKPSYELKYLRSYTKDAKTLNASLNADSVSLCGTEIRELDKCIIGLKHDMKAIFHRVWKQKNAGYNIERIKTLCVNHGLVAAFRGARIGSSEYKFLCGCEGTSRTIRNKSFMSCSLDYGVALKFTSMWGRQSGQVVIFLIYLGQTDDWSYAYVRQYSHYPSEEEIIVRPCRRFRVVDVAKSSSVTHIALSMVW